MRRRIKRLRLHARAIRLKEVIGYLGFEQGVEYGRRRGWIDRVDGHHIYLRDPGK